MPIVPEQLFLDQARSDYAIYQALWRQPACHRLHYLQMSTEKLAKAHLWRHGNFPGFKHDKFEQFLKNLHTGRADVHRMFGYRVRRRFDLQWPAILDLGRRIQNLAPAGGNQGPNPEYPWPPALPVTGPLAHNFLEWDDWNNTTAGDRLRYFVENLLADYTAYFP